MTEAFAFWGVAIVIAALALPLAFRLFARFPDAGAGLSYSLGLTLLAAGYFLLRVAGALPAGRGGFLLAIALFGVVMFVFAARDRRFLATLRRSIPGLSIAVALFSALFFGYAWFRAHSPDISHTEQPMDFLYLNSMLVSPDYPPHDPWFAGENASYYYGGYLQAAVLTGASGVWPATGYNLSLAAVLASAGAAAASLCAALARWLFGPRARRWVALAATAGVLLLLFGGPLASVFDLASAHGAAHEGVYNAFGVEGLVRCGSDAGETCTGLARDPTSAWYPDDNWPWWRMSRMDLWGPQPADRLGPAEYLTITEVPAFSFILGDLHPHLMGIPGVLLALALCAVIWRGRGPLSWREHWRRPWLAVVYALLFGALAFVNAWDVVVFSPVLALAVLARNLRGQSSAAAIAGAVSWLLPPALLSVVAYAPWWFDFTPETGGLYAYGGGGTRVEHALLMWGVPAVGVLAALCWILCRWHPVLPTRPFLAALFLALLPLLIWLPLAAFERTAAAGVAGDGLLTALGARSGGAWITLSGYALGFSLLTGAAFALGHRNHPAALVVALGALGLLLLYLTELFLVRDILFRLPRLNTVFKLSYGAWIALSIAGPIGAVAAIRATAPRIRPLVVVPLGALLGAALVFAVTNVPNRAADFDGPARLDGLGYVAALDPGEYALIRWLNANVDPGQVVVEATGRLWARGEGGEPELRRGAASYRSAGRVGYRSGLQTPIGWPWHEKTWRGASPGLDLEIERRQNLVDFAYTAADQAAALAALREIGATYVVVGSVERAHYPRDLMPPFEAFLEVAFSQGGVTVFRLPVFEVVATR